MMNNRQAVILATTLVLATLGGAVEGRQKETSAPMNAEIVEPLGPRVADGMMTRERAGYRAGRVSDLRYALDITLDPAPDHFAGTVEISFTLEGPTPT